MFQNSQLAQNYQQIQQRLKSTSDGGSNKINASTANNTAAGKGDEEEHSAPQTPPAPTPAMYWSRVTASGQIPPGLRSHSMTVINDKIYVFGGFNSEGTYNDTYMFDPDTIFWLKLETYGECPPPLRAHSATAVEHYLFVFGGGSNKDYFNDLYILDTESLIWSKPQQMGDIPCRRRAHTSFYHNGFFYVHGGGDGTKALSDLYQSNPQQPRAVWKRVNMHGQLPPSRGYHTSTLVRDKLLVYGGANGTTSYEDCHVLDLLTYEWRQARIPRSDKRLAHSSVLVGSYLYVIGGHTGASYSNDVMPLNLVNMQWEEKTIYGKKPSPRAYHSCVLFDSRVFMFGGFDHRTTFAELYILELSGYAYLPQVTDFDIELDTGIQSN
ncbi:galactose oxidase [Ramicandelaber brevisporus]|nr:galactose oxidase [Ramicandelaber brevisporus]